MAKVPPETLLLLPDKCIAIHPAPTNQLHWNPTPFLRSLDDVHLICLIQLARLIDHHPPHSRHPPPTPEVGPTPLDWDKIRVAVPNTRLSHPLSILIWCKPLQATPSDKRPAHQLYYTARLNRPIKRVETKIPNQANLVAPGREVLPRGLCVLPLFSRDNDQLRNMASRDVRITEPCSSSGTVIAVPIKSINVLGLGS